MRHEAQSRRDLPAVGDWVAVQWPSRQERATIQHILPRTSLFSRKVAGQETTEQILAANVNVAFLVAGLDRDFNIRRLERYLAMTWESGARPVVVLNKADLADDVETCRAEVAGIAGGVPVHTISSKLGSGIEELFPVSAAGHDRRPAGVVRRREVDVDQPPGWPRAAAHTRRAGEGLARAAHDDAP